MTNSLTIFLVDSSWPGVSVEKNDQTIGNLNQAKITFRDVLVPDGKKSSIHFAFLFFNLPIRFFFIDAMISLPGTGQYIQQRTTMHSRIQHGLLNLTQMKLILQHMHSMAASTERETETEE